MGVQVTGKKYQQLFEVVYAYQTGKLSSDKVSQKVKRIAKTITSEEAFLYATTPEINLNEVRKIFNSPEYISYTLDEIIKTKTPEYVKGQLIDVFTAYMIKSVASKLTDENKKLLFNESLNKIVALSYKILTD